MPSSATHDTLAPGCFYNSTLSTLQGAANTKAAYAECTHFTFFTH